MNSPEELAMLRAITYNYWGRYTLNDLQKSIRTKNIGRTHQLISSLAYSNNSSGDETKLALEFNYYGKMLDMGVGRGRPLESVSSNREVYRAIGQKNKSNKWFSKVAYTNIASLRKIIEEKYGEDASTIITELSNYKINISL